MELRFTQHLEAGFFKNAAPKRFFCSVTQTHYSILISRTQFSRNSIGSVFGWKFLVVFQFKNSILSKVVGPTKINAKQMHPLHFTS